MANHTQSPPEERRTESYERRMLANAREAVRRSVELLRRPVYPRDRVAPPEPHDKGGETR